MAKKINKKCIICGEEYSYCPDCSGHSDKPTWYNDFESENCKNIYDACAGYWMKHLTKEQAMEILKTCDLSKKDKFNKTTAGLVDEIMKEDKVVEQKAFTPKKQKNKK